jgi:phosphatidate cytidylyltransferase
MVVAAIIPMCFELSTLNSPLSTLNWIGIGLTVVIFGTWGDLIESLFKRTIGIKDSGNILPGHGGMLDRFDSSLLAIPAAVVYIYTLLYI